MKKILVPIDLSENAINALKYANAYANEQQSSIVLLNIYTGDVSNYEAGWPVQEDLDAIKPERTAILEKIVQQNCTVPTQIEIIEGDVVESIVTYSKNNAIELIIMGTHGASGLKAVLLGSNTSNVVAQAEIPVLAIPMNYSYAKIDKIIYASDFNEFKTELDRIVPIAASIHSSIEVLHLSYNNDDYEANETQFNTAKHQLQTNVEVAFKQRLVSMEEPLTIQLKTYLATQQNALLAMFTQERDWFGKLFLSSKTEELANDLELPLLSFKKKM